MTLRYSYIMLQIATDSSLILLLLGISPRRGSHAGLSLPFLYFLRKITKAPRSPCASHDSSSVALSNPIRGEFSGKVRANLTQLYISSEFYEIVSAADGGWLLSCSTPDEDNSTCLVSGIGKTFRMIFSNRMELHCLQRCRNYDK